MLIERKGASRAVLYFPFKETRGRHFLAPLFAYLRGPRRPRTQRAGGRLLLRPRHGVPRRAAGSRAHRHLRHRPRLRGHAAREDRGRRPPEGRRRAAPRQRRDAPAALRATAPSTSSWSSGWWSTCRRATAAPRWTSTTACSRPAGTSPCSTRPTARSPWRRTRWGCPSSSGCPRRWRIGTRASAARAVSRGRYAELRGRTAPAGAMPRWRDCLPSAGAAGLDDVTEEAGYGWRFFRDTARSPDPPRAAARSSARPAAALARRRAQSLPRPAVLQPGLPQAVIRARGDGDGPRRLRPHGRPRRRAVGARRRWRACSARPPATSSSS